MAVPTETRVHTSLLAAIEKRCLIAMARRLPDWVGSDHLTALGAVAMLGAGMAFWLGGRYPLALLAVVVLLAVNWFGDSLDGTLARVRHQERPRYGFYVDHVLDVLGILFLFAGLVAGGFMTPIAGAGFLLAYYLLTIEIALATHTVGTFKICTGRSVRPSSACCWPPVRCNCCARPTSCSSAGTTCCSTSARWSPSSVWSRRSSRPQSATPRPSTAASRCRRARIDSSGRG